jgi:hypothetical protein
MLVTYNQSLKPVLDTSIPQFMSRVFCDQSGRQFRLTFLVTIVNGEFKGRLVSAEPLSNRPALAGEVSFNSSNSDAANNEVFCLPIYCPVKVAATEYVHTFAEVVSPYFSVDFLINCQPTRAPSKN